MTAHSQSAISQDPLASRAVGETVGQLIEALPDRPQVLFVFITDVFSGAIEDIASAYCDLLHPDVLLGVVARTVLGRGAEVTHSPAVSVLGVCGLSQVCPIRLDPSPAGNLQAAEVWPDDLSWNPQHAIFLSDPKSFAIRPIFEFLDAKSQPVSISGGEGFLPDGTSYFALNNSVYRDGAVGVAFGTQCNVSGLRANGCMPIGRPYTVTRAEANVIFELGGKSARARINDLAKGQLNDDAITQVSEALYVGRVHNDLQDTYRASDFVVQPVIGSNHSDGSVRLNTPIPVGATVQFQIPLPESGDADLKDLLAPEMCDAALFIGAPERADYALESPHHEALLLETHLGAIPFAGARAQRQFGRVHRTNEINEVASSLTVFGQAHELK